MSSVHVSSTWEYPATSVEQMSTSDPLLSWLWPLLSLELEVYCCEAWGGVASLWEWCTDPGTSSEGLAYPGSPG